MRPPATHRRPINDPLLTFRSSSFLRALGQAQKFARHDSIPLLLEGESGTGKSILAQHLHGISPRSAGPFVKRVLSTIVDELAGAELFGHLEGAFTGARANRAGWFVSASGGTLFLDEIGKASPAVQRMLLDAVESKEVLPLGSNRDVQLDVRIFAASNVALTTLASGGAFLPDLWNRLAVFRIELPPLRERRADIPLLVRHYVELYAPEFGYEKAPEVDKGLMEALQAAPWPGNLRELSKTVQRLLVEADGAPCLTLQCYPDDLEPLSSTSGRSRGGTLSEVEAREAVARTNGNVAAAARLLGVHRTTLHRHLPPEQRTAG